MDRILLRTGYDFQHTFRAKLDGVQEDLSLGTIKASLKNEAKTVEWIADTAQANTSPAAWATGVIAIRFTAAQTATLVALMTPAVAVNAWIELSVVLSTTRLPYADIPVLIEIGYTLS